MEPTREAMSTPRSTTTQATAPPSTPESSHRKRKALQDAFTTPSKVARTANLSSPAAAAAAINTPLPPPSTPPSSQRPVGIFGSQARKMRTGRPQPPLDFNSPQHQHQQDNLNLNPTLDLPPTQALHLYEEIANLIEKLPALVTKPLIEMAKRVEVVESENRKLRGEVERLATGDREEGKGEGEGKGEDGQALM